MAWLTVNLALGGCVVVTRKTQTAPPPSSPPSSERVIPPTPSDGPVDSSTEPVVQSDRIAAMEREVRERVNAIRREHGLDPLRANEQLSEVARDYSRVMANKEFFSHYGPTGRNVADRVRAEGISFLVIAENLFKSINAPDPVKTAVQGWMDSPGHRKNILRENVTETGVGIWKDGNTYHITQVFIHPR